MLHNKVSVNKRKKIVIAVVALLTLSFFLTLPNIKHCVNLFQTLSSVRFLVNLLY